ncbi:MAG: envelope integrity protein Cei [Gordonia sp. (in: high G+C Gram-positive bacteria)]
MVSQITTGYPTDHKGNTYRRRRPVPAIIIVAVLAVAALTVWIIALTGATGETTPVACNRPSPVSASPSPTAATSAPTSSSSTVVARDDLISVSPAPLSAFTVRVLNASTQRGAARSASDDLTSLGFTPAADSAFGDDPLYPNQDLQCVGQIRFGPGGKAAAAAVWLAIPCAELVDDGRRDTSVDVALGEYYRPTAQSQDAQAALDVLRTADPRNPDSGVEPSLIEAVHSRTC